MHFHHRTYFSSCCARGAGDVLAKAEGAAQCWGHLARKLLQLPQISNVAVIWSPSLPDLKTRHPTPWPCVTSTRPLLEGFAVLRGSRWADAWRLRSRGKQPRHIYNRLWVPVPQSEAVVNSSRKKNPPIFPCGAGVFATCHTDFCSLPTTRPGWCYVEVNTEPLI